ncbi:DUF4440 domain-containing protein [filamentous cyanobacterium CCP5]|nr:DUF4440 domain-containing protein [filamentous cyanobacterium CCP5]
MVNSHSNGATQRHIESCIKQARQAWLNADPEGFVNLFAENGEFIVPGQKWQGREQILGAFQAFTSSYFVTTIEIRNLVVQGNRAMVEWSWVDTEIKTGQVSLADDAIALDFQGQSIQRWREYIDRDSPQTTLS